MAVYDGSWTEWGNTVGVPISSLAIAAFAVSGWVFALTMLIGVWISIRLRLHQ